MPEANTSDPAGTAGGTPWRMGGAGRGGERHSLSGNGLPILSPKTPADGQMLPEGQGLRQGVGKDVGVGSVRTHEG